MIKGGQMKKTIFTSIISFILVSSLLIAGCTGKLLRPEQATQEIPQPGEDEGALCNPPYIGSDGDCCLDNDSDSLCDEIDSTISTINSGLADEGGAADDLEEVLANATTNRIKGEAYIKVTSFLGDIDSNTFNSMVFMIENIGEKQILNPVISIEAYYVRPGTNAQEKVYQFTYPLNEILLKGQTYNYKIPISPMAISTGPVKNTLSRYNILVNISEAGTIIGSDKETISISPIREIAESSFSTSFKPVRSTDHKSTIEVVSLGASYDGGLIDSITVNLNIKDGIKKPVLDLFYGEDYSIVLNDLGYSAYITKQIPLSIKVDPGAKIDGITLNLRDGAETDVYSVTEEKYYMNCDRDKDKFRRCELQHAGTI